MPDYRKYVTSQSEGNGEKIHIWQKHFHKYQDVQFYKRFLGELSFPVRFEFMEAHPELVTELKNDEEHFRFYKLDEIPVAEFLSRGHVYLYRTSNLWRDNYPRVVGEALAAGLPVLTEPRDGTLDRTQHGDTGLFCIDHDAYLYGLKLFHRKEDYRYKIGLNAKEWAKNNLDPRKWVEIINGLLL